MRLKRTLVISVIVLVALAGIGFIGLQVWLQILAIDEEPPDDSDLLVQTVEIADELNAFHWLRKAADRAEVPWEMTEEEDRAAWEKAKQELRELGLFGANAEVDGEENGGLGIVVPDGGSAGEGTKKEEGPARHEIAEDRLFHIIDNGEWDETFARDVLEANEPVFDDWRRAVSCDAIQVPWLLTMKDGRRITGRLGRLLRLKGAECLHRLQPGKARDLALEVVTMGQRWEGGYGSLPGYRHGSALKASGVCLLRMWADKAAPDSHDLRRAAKWLADYGANQQAVQYGLRVEYMLNALRLEQMVQGKMTLADIGPMVLGENGLEGTWPQERLQPDWRLRPNETKRIMAEWYRALIQAVPEPYARITAPSLPPKQKGLVDVLCQGNTYGVMICCAVLPSTEYVILPKCRENIQIAAVRILLALRAYREDAGRLPAGLNELVPQYLDQAPLDDFDGRPLRYNPEKRVIYSVGEDLKDEGGMTDEEIDTWWKQEEPWKAERGYTPWLWNLPDPSWPIEF